MSSMIVGSSAVMWMAFANVHGPASAKCRHLAHEYNESLDEEGCEALQPGVYRSLPSALRSNLYPAWMADKFEKRMARTGGGGQQRLQLAAPTRAEGASLLDKLYAMETSIDGGASTVRLDEQLTT